MNQRILFLDALNDLAGGQQILLQIAVALDNYECLALLPQPGRLSTALENEGISCHFAEMADYTLVDKSPLDVARFPSDQMQLVRACQRLVHQNEIDLIYANSTRTFIWGTLAARITNTPIIWHLHNVVGDAKTRGILRAAGQLDIVRNIIAVSQDAACVVDNLKYKTTVVHNGVDTERFRPQPSAGQSVREELGIAPDRFTVGIVGDLIPLKRQDTLLKACMMLPEQPVCLIVGSARPDNPGSLRYESALKALSGAQTIFTGRRCDIPEVLNALDMLIIASERETGPVVLLEGMSTGLPILSTPVGQCPEALPRECLFPVNDAKTLAALLQLHATASDMRKSIGARNRTVASSTLSLQQFQSSIQSVVADVIHPERAGG